MTAWNDLPGEMRGERIDAGTMERLFRGRLTPDDAPPGYSHVASILLTAASPTEPTELAMEVEHVAAARAVLEGRYVGRRPTRRVLAAAIVAGALMILPGLAAANVLPDPAQHAVSSVLDKVGISVPSGNEEHPSNPGGHPASTGPEISRIATTTDATGVAKGAEISSIASGGKSQAGQHGKASDAPHGAPPQEPGSHGESGDSGQRGQSGDAMTNGGPSNAGSEHASPKAGVAPTHP
jgi:hypothetical protein